MAETDTKNLLVFIEQRKGVIRKASLEALSEALRQSKNIGGDVIGVLISDKTAPLLTEISALGPNKILTIESAEYANYATEAYASALESAIKQTNPKICICC